MWIYIVQGMGYGLTAAAQPGAFQTYLISQGLTRGWKKSFPVIFGPLISDGPIIILMTLILSQVPESWQRGLHVASGVFVLYLAWGAFLSWRNFKPSEVDEAPAHQSLFKAALMNAISPGPYLFWGLVTGPLLLEAWRMTPWYGVAFLLGFYGVMLATLLTFLIIFGTARKLGPKVNRAMIGISAIALVVFGLYQLYQGFFQGA